MKRNPAHGIVRRALLAATLLVVALWTRTAEALPSFAQQTGEPCKSCHVGAYGPQLKAYGRDFKLFGYVSGDGGNHLPPITAIFTESSTHTHVDRTPIPGYGANDNIAYQGALIAYAGNVGWGVGAFAEATYDALRDKWSISRVDVRRAFTTTFGDRDLVLGVELNNRPGLGDLWNSTPVFEFSTFTSPFAPSPATAAAVDGRLAARAGGVGAYGLWNDTVYAEGALYTPLDRNLRNREGVSTPPTTDEPDGISPYWRIALQHDFGQHHYGEIGAYGLQTRRFPNDRVTAGHDTFTDWALDGTYQYDGGNHHYLTAHATWINEDIDLSASRRLQGTAASNRLNVFRADAIYSYDNTWTPGVEYFRTTGTSDPRFFRNPVGRPDTEGYVLELAYVPLGKPNSVVNWANARFNLRWVEYTRFNGNRAGASDSNTIYVGAAFALAPFGALVTR